MPPAHRSRDNEGRITDAPGLELRRVRDRELQLKRITGEISCAECRRYVDPNSFSIALQL